MTFVRSAYFYRFPTAFVVGPEFNSIELGPFYSDPHFLDLSAQFDEIGGESLLALSKSMEVDSVGVARFRADNIILTRMGFKTWSLAFKKSLHVAINDVDEFFIEIVPMIKMGRGFGSDDARAIKILRTNVSDIGQALTELTVL